MGDAKSRTRCVLRFNRSKHPVGFRRGLVSWWKLWEVRSDVVINTWARQRKFYERRNCGSGGVKIWPKINATQRYLLGEWKVQP